MKFLTKELEKKLPPLGSTENVPTEEKEIIVKFFSPYSNWTWYAVEYDPTDRVFFGLVHGFEKEWGYFSLDELESAKKGSLNLVERDLWWKVGTKIKDII